MPENATLLPELALASSIGARYVAGVDEVGRGALAGPVTVGVTVFDLYEPGLEYCPTTGVVEGLDGVRDSKLLTAAARQRWAPVVLERAASCSVQHREAARIDQIGITAALREAGLAGLDEVENSLGLAVDAVILDGSHDWLTGGASPRVHPLVKADVKALSVASASVVAKVRRDALMADLAQQHPGYGWESNRGYGSAAHRAALVERGLTPQHRRSWKLVPGRHSLRDAALRR
ncbi:ribonuclease HII [Nesterenkonia sp. PF2B19]|uniref:ribonuclease HII n=1 Tax=unclassified Nesterenkonia TaxID=2629769 RepID=UPI0008721AD6|nr:ribonuclease HII [Nesterenkonia sp. PF2B19]OSM44530.1 ribonuclease HII [Nesterenkonia sp. PF2B19]